MLLITHFFKSKKYKQKVYTLLTCVCSQDIHLIYQDCTLEKQVLDMQTKHTWIKETRKLENPSKNSRDAILEAIDQMNKRCNLAHMESNSCTTCYIDVQQCSICQT